MQEQQQQLAITKSTMVTIDKNQKCITCGGPIIINPKRKGPKLIRCETCINNDNVSHVRGEILIVYLLLKRL